MAASLLIATEAAVGTQAASRRKHSFVKSVILKQQSPELQGKKNLYQRTNEQIFFNTFWFTCNSTPLYIVYLKSSSGETHTHIHTHTPQPPHYCTFTEYSLKMRTFRWLNCSGPNLEVFHCLFCIAHLA